MDYDSLDEANFIWLRFDDYFRAQKAQEVVQMILKGFQVSPSYLEIKIFFFEQLLDEFDEKNFSDFVKLVQKQVRGTNPHQNYLV
jgi:hypothetical protein